MLGDTRYMNRKKKRRDPVKAIVLSQKNGDRSVKGTPMLSMRFYARPGNMQLKLSVAINTIPM